MLLLLVSVVLVSVVLGNVLEIAMLEKELVKEFNVQKGYFEFLEKPIFASKYYGPYFWSALTEYGILCMRKENDTILPQDDTVQCSDHKYANGFQLEENEMILMVGKTPPKVVSYKLQHMVQYRYSDISGWQMVLGTLDGPFTDTGGFQTNSSSDVYDVYFGAVVTNDVSGVLNLPALLERFVPRLHVLHIPDSIGEHASTKLKFGHGVGSEIFSIGWEIMRTNDVHAYGQLQRYMKDVPIHVYRLGAKEYVKQPVLFSPNELSPNANKVNHTQAQTSEKSLEVPLAVLARQVTEILKSGQYTIWQNWITLHHLHLYSHEWALDCIGGWAEWLSFKCFGNAKDTSFHALFPQMKLQDTDDLYIIGVNHKKTGVTAHTHISLVDMHTQTGFTGVSLDALVGSAYPYLKDSLSSLHSQFLYVAKFSNHCKVNESFCYSYNANLQPTARYEPNALLPIVHSLHQPKTGLAISPLDETILKPFYLVARRTTHRPSAVQSSLLFEVHRLLLAIFLDLLGIEGFNPTPFTIDALLIYALGQEYMSVLVITYLLSCICATSLLHIH